MIYNGACNILLNILNISRRGVSMSIQKTETEQKFCTKSSVCKTLFWSLLAAVFLTIFVGLPITRWIL